MCSCVDVGALGKRTRYQQTDVAQLLVDVDREDGTKPLGMFLDLRFMSTTRPVELFVTQ